MYDIKNVLDNSGKVYAGRIVIDNKDGTISKFWLCEDDRQLRKSTEDYRLEMISKIKDEYKNYIVKHGDVFKNNIRIGNYITYNKIEGYTPKHPNIFNQYIDIQLLYEKLINLVIDTTIKSKWKHRDWNINNIIVDKNHKFHLIDLDSITDNYNYDNILGAVGFWDINGVKIDDNLKQRLMVLKHV